MNERCICGSYAVVSGFCSTCGRGSIVADAKRGAAKRYGAGERERDSIRDTRRHAHGFAMQEGFRAKMASLGVKLVEQGRYHRFNWRVDGRDVWIDGRGRAVFTQRGYLEHSTLIVGAAKMRWATDHPEARCMVAWHSQDLRFVVFVRDLAGARERMRFEPRREDPVRTWQREDTYHVPARDDVLERGWDELAAAVAGHVYKPVLL